MAFEPTDLPNLWAWYRGDAGVSILGSDVATVADQSGNTRTLNPVTGKAPEYAAATLNGLPVISSYDREGHLKTSDHFTGTEENLTIYIVGRQAKGTGGDLDSDGLFLQIPSIANIKRSFNGSTDSLIAVSFRNGSEMAVAATNGTWYTITAQYGGGSRGIALNDQDPTTASFAFTSTTSGPLNVLASNFNTQYGNKQIAEILIYTANHNDNEKALVQYYLQQKYNHYTWTDPIPTNDETAVITFPELPTKKVGDADFAPGATSNSPATITYTSSNPAVATIVGGMIHIAGAGTTTITASQAATDGYTAAEDVSQTLTVNIQQMAQNELDNALQADDIVFEVRVVGDSGEFKTLVCELDNQLQLTNDVSETDTKCGTHVGIKRAKGNISGNASHNVVPTSLEVSYNMVADWQLNKALLEYRYKNAAFTAGDGSAIGEGEAVYFTGQGRFVDSTYQGSTGEIMQFSWTFKPSSITNEITS